MNGNKQYRYFEIRAGDESGIVEGYAATFEQPTVLWSYDGVDYSEVIGRTAFDRADMADVVMNFGHGGKPVARTKNKTLILGIDTVGLKIRADLSGTDEGRKLYEEIKGGYIDKMSFAFIAHDDGEEYDKATHTRRITGIKKLYDVAAVDFPAYDTTSVSARSYFEAQAGKEAAEAEMLETRKDKLKLKLKLGGHYEQTERN